MPDVKRVLHIEIQISDLVPFKNHPFKPYEGKRLADMVESVKTNNIMSPIIVRPLADDKYEILSGHNRVNAAKLLERLWRCIIWLGVNET